MSQRTLIFVNPIAGRGRAARVAQMLSRRLGRDGLAPEVIEQAPDHFNPPADADALVIIGGDGTLRAVAGRFWQTRGAVPPMLMVPVGTANLMAQHLQIRWTPGAVAEQISAALAQRRLRSLDVATINRRQLFFLMAGAGIDGQIAHILGKIRRGPINYASWVMPAAAALGMYDYPPLTVRVDGVTRLDDAPAMAFIGNVAEHGIGFPVTPGAEPNDGALDVMLVRCRSVAELFSRLLLAVGGELANSEDVISMRGKSIEIESPVEVPLQADGDPAGHTPVKIDLLDTRMSFILPAE